jgi:hypothetical protein
VPASPFRNVDLLADPMRRELAVTIPLVPDIVGGTGGPRGINPPSALSVSTAAATVRCATILAECGQTPASIGYLSHPTKFVEVYPPASLSQRGLPYTGYKSASGQKLLVSMVTKLVRFTAVAGPWLKLDRWIDTRQTEVGAFDVVICAVTARAIALEPAIIRIPPPNVTLRLARAGSRSLTNSHCLSSTPSHASCVLARASVTRRPLRSTRVQVTRPRPTESSPSAIG